MISISWHSGYLCIFILFCFLFFEQRQAERRKRDQQYKDRHKPRGDDAEPNVDPSVLFPVSLSMEVIKR